MIITLILFALYSVLKAPFLLLPASSGLPTPIADALTYFSQQISQWTFIFPIDTVITILGYTLLVEITLWSFGGAVWIYNKIRGI